MKQVYMENVQGKIIYDIQNEAIPHISLEYGIIENNNLIKTISFMKTDDYYIEGFTFENDNSSKIEIVLTENDLLYQPFLNFLKQDNQVTIDNDYSREYNRKTFTVKKVNDLISLIIDNKEDTNFRIVIINIFYDGRSKIDQDVLDTKDRLKKLFKDFNEMVIENQKKINNQIKTLK